MIVVALVLALVVLPIVVVLLRNVLAETTSIVGSIDRITAAAQAGSRDLDAAPLLLTTQQQVRDTVANVAAYGGSLDVIVDDA
jgi:hypothetical protein